jgi:ribosome-associated toxin RatA of RatAB toxin-antitoxin module
MRVCTGLASDLALAAVGLGLVGGDTGEGDLAIRNVGTKVEAKILAIIQTVHITLSMKTVHKSVLIWYSTAQMFDLVTDVVHYPQFLPWCDHARVLALTDTGMSAEVGIAIGGVKQSFTTQNEHHIDEVTQARHVILTLVNGPFSNLDGRWDFIPVGDASQGACRTELRLNYGFDNPMLAKLVGPVFDKIAASFVDAFVKRAEQVYG